MLSQLKGLFPFMEYYINYDYISQVLCVNKDDVTPTCQGKCHIKKQLKKTHEQDDSSSQRIKLQVEKNTCILLRIFDFSAKTYCFLQDISILKKVSFNLRSTSIRPATPPPECCYL